MKNTLLSLALATLIAAPALAQPVVVHPAGPEANPAVNAAIAQHDRKVAVRAARHGNFHKAARAAHAAHRASADAHAPR